MLAGMAACAAMTDLRGAVQLYVMLAKASIHASFLAFDGEGVRARDRPIGIAGTYTRAAANGELPPARRRAKRRQY